MTNQHPITPITPPLELVDSIWNQFKTGPTRNLLTSEAFREAITKASQWGADQELEACIAFVRRGPWCSEKLRAARRPKPPTDKELAIRELGDAYDKGKIDDTTYYTILRALRVQIS